MENISNDILIIIKNNEEKIFYHIPKEFVPEEVKNLEEYDINGNFYFYDKRLICHKYFGIGLDTNFTQLYKINDKNNIYHKFNMEEYEKIIESKPLFENYKIDIKKENLSLNTINLLDTILMIKLNSRINLPHQHT